jgi:hypothetical protein
MAAAARAGRLRAASRPRVLAWRRRHAAGVPFLGLRTGTRSRFTIALGAAAITAAAWRARPFVLIAGALRAAEYPFDADEPRANVARCARSYGRGT